MVGLNDLKGLLQPEQFYDSVFLSDLVHCSEKGHSWKRQSQGVQEYKAAKLYSCNFNFASQALLPSPHMHAVQPGSLL